MKHANRIYGLLQRLNGVAYCARSCFVFGIGLTVGILIFLGWLVLVALHHFGIG